LQRISAFVFVGAAALVGCASEPPSTNVVDNPGARNDAFRAAARTHRLPEDWLVAIGYQQGRFEAADAIDDNPADAPVEESAWTLSADTPVDETDGTTDDGASVGDDDQSPPAFGVMYLTDDQVTRAAELTGHDSLAIRTDIGTNIDAAATLIADGWDGTDTGLRTQTTAFLAADDDADTRQLALQQIDGVLSTGFDLTTSDGEHLALAGTETEDAIARVKPGHYPPIQWIPSPNFSSRLGYSIRYVAIHDIEGTMAGAIAVFKNKANQTSAHYIVRSHDGHIVQMVHEAEDAWHVGHGWFNRHSIGIEHEGFAHKKNGGGYYTDTLYGASAQLTCAIVHKYGIPVDRKHIFGHYNVPSNLSSHTLCSDARGIAGACGGVNHHSDPGRYWNWTKYMKLVSSCVKAI
jgi:N-acetyl-anhydromuramyl-L-alanine amidase AmpD